MSIICWDELHIYVLIIDEMFKRKYDIFTIVINILKLRHYIIVVQVITFKFVK